MLDDAWFIKMCEISKLIREFEAGTEVTQGYIHLRFFTPLFNWGDIRFRNAMSGRHDGQIEFHSLDDCVGIIKMLVGEREPDVGR